MRAGGRVVFQSWIVVVFQQDCHRWFVRSIVIRFSRYHQAFCTYNTICVAEKLPTILTHPTSDVRVHMVLHPPPPRFPRKIDIILHYSVRRHIFDSDVIARVAEEKGKNIHVILLLGRQIQVNTRVRASDQHLFDSQSDGKKKSR